MNAIDSHALATAIRGGIERFGQLETAAAPLERLSLLDEYLQRRRANLTNTAVVLLQHQLAPLVARVNAMYACGLKPNQIWFLDIPYSTNTAVRARLQRELGQAEQMCSPFEDPLVCYSQAQRDRVQEILHKVADQRTAQDLVIIDDGAYVCRAIAASMDCPQLREKFRGTRIVEQTTRGHVFLESAVGQRCIRELGLRVVSIARASTKLHFEAPFIGVAVGRALTQAINEHEIPLHRALVIGFGAIGCASAVALRRAYQQLHIDVFDSNSVVRTEAQELNFETLEELPKERRDGLHYELVLGCTGATSFTWHDRHLLAPRALLASGSSAAVEVDRAQLVEIAERGHPDDEGLKIPECLNSGIRSDLRFNYGADAHFVVLRAGFPVNFDGQPEHMPTVMIAPTHCLLFAGLCQVMQTERVGLWALDAQEDEWILRRAVTHLTQALSL